MPNEMNHKATAKMRYCWSCGGELGVIERRHYAPRDPRAPDYSRPGIFATHNCWKCRDGQQPCAQGDPRRCEFPHARND